MDRDTPGRYEQFAPPADHQPAAEQPKQQQFYPKLNLGGQTNQFGSGTANPNNNQPNSGQPNLSWLNQSNDLQTQMAQFKLSDQEQKILRVCKTGTFFTLSKCGIHFLLLADR